MESTNLNHEVKDYRATPNEALNDGELSFEKDPEDAFPYSKTKKQIPEIN